MLQRAKITDHAVQRFVERHAPHMSFEEARRHLYRASAHSNKLKEKTLRGQFQWEINDPYCVLVIKFDRGNPICVTVLPEKELSRVDMAEMEMEYFGTRPINPRADGYMNSILNKKEPGEPKEKPEETVRSNADKNRAKKKTLIGLPRIIPDDPKNFKIPAHPMVGSSRSWSRMDRVINEAMAVSGEDPVDEKLLSQQNSINGFVVTPENAELYDLIITKQREKTRRHLISERTQTIWSSFRLIYSFLEKRALEDVETAHFLHDFKKKMQKEIELSNRVNEIRDKYYEFALKELEKE